VKLLGNMQALRELRIDHFELPEGLVKVIRFRNLCLPSVAKLTMHIDENHSKVSPLILEACPNIESLSLDMNGDNEGVHTLGGTDILRSVWAATRRLTRLEELCVFKCGYPCRCVVKWPKSTNSSDCEKPHGWTLEDLSGTRHTNLYTCSYQ
jgi:hypothetical protein